jgi:nucleoside-diphosphate-sugar epimerase
MAKSRTVAITGASGFLGSQLVDHFAGKGWKVVALVRNPGRQKPSAGVKYVPYDLREPVNSKSLEGADYLVHAAYVRQERGTDAFRENVEGAKRLLEAAKAAGVKRRVFISSMSAHAGAVSTYGRQKLAIEKLFDSESGLNLRPGLIIGNGGIVRTMADFMKSKHLVPLPGGGRQPLQTVFVGDLGAAIENALERNTGGTLTIAHPHVYTYKEFYAKLARKLGVKVFFPPLPLTVLLMAVRLAGLLRIPSGIDADNVLGLKKLRSADTAPDLRKLGLELKNLDDSLTAAGF